MRRANWGDDRGQTLVIVALSLTALFGFLGLVADIGWYELNMVRLQRAAAAAAPARAPPRRRGRVSARKRGQCGDRRSERGGQERIPKRCQRSHGDGHA